MDKVKSNLEITATDLGLTTILNGLSEEGVDGFAGQLKTLGLGMWTMWNAMDELERSRIEGESVATALLVKSMIDQWLVSRDLVSLSEDILMHLVDNDNI